MFYMRPLIILLQQYMKKFTTIGLSLPIETAAKIDSERGEPGRSLYIRKILQKAGGIERIK